ncbi:type II toxin-antitoxin system PemK/MazF family toxin [Candidatus Palauibacter sp.]|uniref:type II toxin-antitoxin system PemK/MazF family toxin n=1 Tax=Candidatus Palauibacter sp. TaxID=3101350 RepID=UPI003B517376
MEEPAAVVALDKGPDQRPQGDIVLVSFPFTDLTSYKRRPALVLSPDAFNAAGRDLVLAAITSHITDDSNAVHLRCGDFAEGGSPRHRW